MPKSPGNHSSVWVATKKKLFCLDGFGCAKTYNKNYNSSLRYNFCKHLILGLLNEGIHSKIVTLYLHLDLKEIPLQQGSSSHILSTKETYIVSLEIQNILSIKNEKPMLIALQKQVNFFHP